uniref:Ig-like domain-containing protein n=1 Tax=Cynoglossus semilaevis TaxID=244447 RepID=A0A3P8X438_CYNSE
MGGESDWSEISEPIIPKSDQAPRAPVFREEIRDMTVKYQANATFVTKVHLYYSCCICNYYDNMASLFALKHTIGEARQKTASAVAEVVSVEKTKPARPAKILTKPQSMTVTEGESARFFCDIDGEPAPSVTWRHESRTIVSSHNVQVTTTQYKSSLEIYSVTSSDEGIYTVVVENSEGRQEAQFTLTIHRAALIEEVKVITSTEVSSPAPSVTSPIPKSPEPSVKSLEPTLKSPEPAVKSPEPTVKSPEPTVKSPEPAVKSPEPTVKSPEPTVKSPEPTVKSPEPSVKSPEPTVKSPEPSVKSPAPGVKSPAPGVKSPAPTPPSPAPGVKSPAPTGVKSPEPRLKSPISDEAKTLRGVKSPEPKTLRGLKSPEPAGIKSPRGIKTPEPAGIKSPRALKSPEPQELKSPLRLPVGWSQVRRCLVITEPNPSNPQNFHLFSNVAPTPLSS